jgi:hypothetical protein
MSNRPTTKPMNPLRKATIIAYRRQDEKCWLCKCDISTGYHIEHLIDEIVVLACDACKGKAQNVGRAS